MRLSVVIPCYDEEDAIDAVLGRFKEAEKRILNETSVEQVELIVVDDYSQDGSLQKLIDFSEEHSARIIASRKRLGYGGALKRGFQEATGELIAFYDMDYTYDPFDLVQLINQLEENSEVGLICGDRLSKIQSMPFTREIGNRFFVSIIKSIFRVKVNDCCTGLRVFKRRFLSSFVDLLPNNLDFTLAMTFLFLRFKIPFIEVPVNYFERIGHSKLYIFIDGPRFLFTIFRYWYQLNFKKEVVRSAQLSLGIKKGVADSKPLS